MHIERLKKAGSEFIDNIFGGKVDGFIAEIKYDRKAPFVHLLVETENRHLRHIIKPYYFIELYSWTIRLDGNCIDIPAWEVGNRFHERVRGKGTIIFPWPPWNRVERDPFGLSPKTPLSDSIKELLDKSGIKRL